MLHVPEPKGQFLMMPPCSQWPHAPQGSQKAPKSPSPLRLNQHEGLREQLTWQIRAQPHARRKWEVKEVPTSGVENQSRQSVLHRGASLPSHRSISLSQAWKNPDPGFNFRVVFKARSCRAPAGPTSSSFPCCVLLLAAQSPKQTHPGRAVDAHTVPVHTLTHVDNVTKTSPRHHRGLAQLTPPRVDTEEHPGSPACC